MIGSRLVGHRSTWAWCLLLVVLVGGAAVLAGTRYGSVDLVLDVESPTSPWLQVFHDRDGGFNERASTWFALQAQGQRRTAIRLRASEARWLRFDLSAGATMARLCPVRMRLAAHDVDFRGAYSIRRVEQLRSAEWDQAGCLALEAQPDAGDPHVVLQATTPLDWPSRSAGRNYALLRLVGIGLLIAAGWGALARFTAGHKPPWPAMDRGMSRLDAGLPWMALMLILIAGSQHAWRAPPNYAPDEVAHLAKVSRIVSGHPFSNADGRELLAVSALYGRLGNLLHDRSVLDPIEVGRIRDAPLACERVPVQLPAGATPYFPHVYLPTAATYVLGCSAQASFGRFLDAARALNLLLAALLVFWAVRVSGPARWPIAVVAALPMTVAQFASISADALTISMSLAAVGGLIGAASGTRSLKALFPWLVCLSVGLALAKPGTPWVLGLALLAWQRCREQGFSRWTWLGCLLVLPLLVHGAWTALATGASAGIVREHAQGNAALLLTQPQVFVIQWWNTFFTPHIQVLIRQAIGQLGWLDIMLPAWAYHFGMTALVATVFMRTETKPPPRREALLARTWMLGLAMGSTLLIALPLFVYWSSPTGLYVEGLQGRYFLVSGAVLIAALSRRIARPHQLILGLAIVAILVVLNQVAVQQMLDAYYVTGRRH